VIIVIILLGIIHMAYSCLCILLYRSFITPNDQTENTMTAFKALSVCTASAINLVNAVEQMDGHTIAALPWNIAI
jgi:hypothetical protein